MLNAILFGLNPGVSVSKAFVERLRVGERGRGFLELVRGHVADVVVFGEVAQLDQAVCAPLGSLSDSTGSQGLMGDMMGSVVLSMRSCS